jgi:hypothetical protein
MGDLRIQNYRNSLVIFFIKRNVNFLDVLIRRESFTDNHWRDLACLEGWWSKKKKVMASGYWALLLKYQV